MRKTLITNTHAYLRGRLPHDFRDRPASYTQDLLTDGVDHPSCGQPFTRNPSSDACHIAKDQSPGHQPASDRMVTNARLVPTLHIKLRYVLSCATLEVVVIPEGGQEESFTTSGKKEVQALSTHKNDVRVTRTDSSEPMSANATAGGAVRPWTPWQDWVNVALGAYLALAPIWTAGAPAGWFVTLGILAIAAGLWAAGTVSSKAAEWTQIVIGVVVFLAPWLGGFAAAAGAAWTAWIIGVALVIFAAAGMTMNNPDNRAVNTSASV